VFPSVLRFVVRRPVRPGVAYGDDASGHWNRPGTALDSGKAGHTGDSTAVLICRAPDGAVWFAAAKISVTPGNS
jgi:hypothetical protein